MHDLRLAFCHHDQQHGPWVRSHRTANQGWWWSLSHAAERKSEPARSVAKGRQRDLIDRFSTWRKGRVRVYVCLQNLAQAQSRSKINAHALWFTSPALLQLLAQRQAWVDLSSWTGLATATDGQPSLVHTVRTSNFFDNMQGDPRKHKSFFAPSADKGLS